MVNFVPIVLGNGKIHLEVAASISQPNSTVGVSIATAGSLASAPGLTTRGAQVAVQLEDGQTLAIGGLIQNTVNGQTTKIPVLGDLPFFGAAFRAVTYTETEEELIILVTPRLVDPMACNQLKPLSGPGNALADDYELFLEGIMEAPRGQSQRLPRRPLRWRPTRSREPTRSRSLATTNRARPAICGTARASGNCFSGEPAPTSPSSFQPPSSANQSTFSGQPTFNGQPTYVTQPSYMTRPTFGQSRPDSQLGARRKCWTRVSPTIQARCRRTTAIRSPDRRARLRRSWIRTCRRTHRNRGRYPLACLVRCRTITHQG